MAHIAWNAILYVYIISNLVVDAACSKQARNVAFCIEWTALAGSTYLICFDVVFFSSPDPSGSGSPELCSVDNSYSPTQGWGEITRETRSLLSHVQRRPLMSDVSCYGQ